MYFMSWSENRLPGTLKNEQNRGKAPERGTCSDASKSASVSVVRYLTVRFPAANCTPNFLAIPVHSASIPPAGLPWASFWCSNDTALHGQPSQFLLSPPPMTPLYNCPWAWQTTTTIANESQSILIEACFKTTVIISKETTLFESSQPFFYYFAQWFFLEKASKDHKKHYKYTLKTIWTA